MTKKSNTVQNSVSKAEQLNLAGLDVHDEVQASDVFKLDLTKVKPEQVTQVAQLMANYNNGELSLPEYKKEIQLLLVKEDESVKPLPKLKPVQENKEVTGVKTTNELESTNTSNKNNRYEENVEMSEQQNELFTEQDLRLAYSKGYTDGHKAGDATGFHRGFSVALDEYVKNEAPIKTEGKGQVEPNYKEEESANMDESVFAMPVGALGMLGVLADPTSNEAVGKQEFLNQLKGIVRGVEKQVKPTSTTPTPTPVGTSLLKMLQTLGGVEVAKKASKEEPCDCPSCRLEREVEKETNTKYTGEQAYKEHLGRVSQLQNNAQSELIDITKEFKKFLGL